MNKLPHVNSKEPAEATLRSMLDDARSALATPEEVTRLRAKLGELPATSTPMRENSHAAGKGATVATKTTVACVVIAGIVALGLIAARTSMLAPAPPATTPESPHVSMSTAPIAPALQMPMPAVVQDAGSESQIADRSKSSNRRRSKQMKTESPMLAAMPDGPSVSASAELKLLMSAQDAVESSPQRALALLKEHERLFQNGNFVQERESLAVDALRKLGLKTAAKARAARFIAAFPQSSYVRRMRRWIEEADGVDHKKTSEPLPTH